jgi:hypothetical protein
MRRGLIVLLCWIGPLATSCRRPSADTSGPIRTVAAETPDASHETQVTPEPFDAAIAGSASAGSRCPAAPAPSSVCDGLRVLLRAMDDDFASVRCANGVSSAVTIPKFRSCAVGPVPRGRSRLPGFGCSNATFSKSDPEHGIETVEQWLNPCFGPEWLRSHHAWNLTGSPTERYCDLENIGGDPDSANIVIMFRCRDARSASDAGALDSAHD